MPVCIVRHGLLYTQCSHALLRIMVTVPSKAVSATHVTLVQGWQCGTNTKSNYVVLAGSWRTMNIIHIFCWTPCGEAPSVSARIAMLWLLSQMTVGG